MKNREEISRTTIDMKYKLYCLKITFFILAILLGFIQAWAHRHNSPGDAIAYMDIGDAYMYGDWKEAVNASWSPLYSLILGLMLFILKPSSYLEFTCVTIVNFVIYLFTIFCFDFFLCKLVLYHKKKSIELSKDDYVTFPEWSLIALGYGFFIFSSLIVLNVSSANPDMLCAGIIFLVSGIMLHIRTRNSKWFLFFLLGLLLGLGYLAKEAMFPLVFVFLLIGIFSVNDFKKKISCILTVLIAFLIVAGPYIFILSKSKGYFTYGEAGKLNYLWDVNNIHYPSQGEISKNGIPKHPFKKIFDNPAIYEFGTRFEQATFPLVYDSSYWYEGVHPHFNLKQQLKTLLINIKMYFHIFFNFYLELIFVFILLFYLSQRKLLFLKDILGYSILVFPAIIVLGMYSLVHVEPRYIGIFVLLLWLGLFLAVRLPDSEASRKFLSSATIAILIIIMGKISYEITHNVSSIIQDLAKGKQANTMWVVANGLSKMGIKPLDKVVTIVDGTNQYWARLARVKIIAEMPSEDDVNKFWEAQDAVKLNLMKAIVKTGAKAIVTKNIPQYAYDNALKNGWQWIEGTEHYAYILDAVK